MSEFFFNLIAVSGKIGEGVHIVCSNVLVGGASSPSLTGFPACFTNSEFFWDGFLSCQQQAFRPVPQRVIFFCGVISCQQQAFRPVPQRVIFFGMGFYPVSNRLSGLFYKELFFLRWVSILSATGKMPVPQKVIFFGMDRHYQHNFFPKRRQVRYDVISLSVLAGSSR